MGNCFTDIGLTLNIIGTLMIAFAFGRFPKEFGGSTTGENGKEYHFSYLLHPSWLLPGTILLVVGFLVQLSVIQAWLTQIGHSFGWW